MPRLLLALDKKNFFIISALFKKRKLISATLFLDNLFLTQLLKTLPVLRSKCNQFPCKKAAFLGAASYRCGSCSGQKKN
jgi:hypothetical protein